MAMRQAAWVTGSRPVTHACAKFDRLVAIVEEAREEGRGA
jgi:hypothetical protein